MYRPTIHRTMICLPALNTLPTEDDGWVTYKNTWLETPWIGLFLKVLPISWFRIWYKLRWQVTYPMQTRMPLIPKYTVGEVLVIFPFIFGLFISLVQSFRNEDCGASGHIASFFAGFTLVTATHNSVVTFALGIPFERTLEYHKPAGFLTVLVGAFHGYSCYKDEGSEDDRRLGEDDRRLAAASSPSTWLPFFFEGIPFGENFTGTVFLIAMALMVVTALHPIRRKLFNLFLYLHIFFFFFVIYGTLAHRSGASSAACAAIGVDYFFRYFYFAIVTYPKKATLRSLDAGVVCLEFPRKYAESRAFQYRGGQYLFVMIPKLGMFEWHPFSISSAPHEDMVSIHVRVLGDWTKKLHELGQTTNEVDVYIEGPYGSPAVDLDSDRYKCVMLFSGGIGITPMQSITNDLLHQSENGRDLKKLVFVWAVRDKAIYDTMTATSHVPDQDNQPIMVNDTPPPPASSNFVPMLVRASSSKVFTDESPDEDGVILHSEFYQTQKKKDTVAEEGNAMKLIAGRPDICKMMTKMRAYAKKSNESRVAVLVCGPEKMVSNVRELCGSLSDGDVAFDFHSETFDF